MSIRSRSIEQSLLAVLSGGRCDDRHYYLPGTQLDRKLYTRTNEVLEALGGKWNRSAKAHVFAEPCADLIDSAIETGEFVRPDDMGWFPTPTALAARIVDIACIQPGMAVLEPSAGLGAIAYEVMKRGADVYCVEIDSGRAGKLMNDQAAPWVVHAGDFLQHTPPTTFDRVVMNPPFAKRADIHHVLHARKFLKPDGLLVSIMSGGIEFRQDRLTEDFRAQCLSIETLPDGSFSESGTEVRTVVITMGAA
jgi:predicted RNA methylase